MENRTFKDVLLVNILLSIPLMFISYLYALFNLNDSAKLQAFFLLGKPFAIDYLANNAVIKYIPLLPVFVSWFFIGVVTYFLYYALTNVYAFAYNQLLIARCKKVEQIDNLSFKLHLLERFGVHFLTISGFLLMILVYFFYLLPLSGQIYQFALAKLAKTETINIWATLLLLFGYWTILVSILQTAWHFIMKLENYETFKQEHESL